MKRLAILACLLATTAAADARSVTAIAFSGYGVVTAADGRGPAAGRGNKIIGQVDFWQPNCIPDTIDGVVDLGSPFDGTNTCDNLWRVRDQFNAIDVFSERTSAKLTFDHGSLTRVYFRGENGPSYLGVDSGQFWGGWYDGVPQYDFNYSGTWTMTDVRIAYDGAPLPGTVPEPASWALMIAGFGLIGSIQRRRAGRLPTAPEHAREKSA